MLKPGLAKTTFSEAHQRSPWLPFREPLFLSKWPFLERLFQEKRVSYLDCALTSYLLSPHADAEQEVALFICHMLLAAKAGHLCIHVKDQEVSPSVIKLWQNDEGQPLMLEEAEALTRLICQGPKKIPPSLMTPVQVSPEPLSPFCYDNHAFYLQRHWTFESLFLKCLNRHLFLAPALAIDLNKAEALVSQLYQENILMQEQAEAILHGLSHVLTLVTGGPGTGKTYTTSYLIKIFWQLLSLEQRQSCQIVLAAPTGKAAANLQLAFHKVTSTLADLPSIPSKTLHNLLGVKPMAPSFQTQARLSADLLIVDESSMIDIKMMASLFAALKPGSRLILLGDQHQLPAVEAGQAFSDLIQVHERMPQLMACKQLTTCLRTELKSLIEFAGLVNRGLAQEALNYLNQPGRPGVKRLLFPSEKREAEQALLSHVLPDFFSSLKAPQDPAQLLQLFRHLRLLSPLRRGPFGVETLNQLIWEKICAVASTQQWLAIPIIITANDEERELFNGETGVLMRTSPFAITKSEDYALFPSRQLDGPCRRIPAFLLPPMN